MSKQLDLNSLLDAIAQTESGNNPNAMGDKGMKYPAYGAYQMRAPAYADVIQSYPQYKDMPLESVLGNAQRQRELASAYLNVLQDRYGLQGVDSLAQAYNAGPGAVRRGKIPLGAQKYLKTIRSHMK